MEGYTRTLSMKRRFRKISPAEPQPHPQLGNSSDFYKAHNIDQNSENYQVVEVVNGARKLRKLFISKDSIVIAKPIDTGLLEVTFHVKGSFPRKEVSFQYPYYFIINHFCLSKIELVSDPDFPKESKSLDLVSLKSEATLLRESILSASKKNEWDEMSGKELGFV